MKRRYFLLPLLVPALFGLHWLWQKFSPHVRSSLKPVKIANNSFSYGFIQESNWELVGNLPGGVQSLLNVGWQDKTHAYSYDISEWKWIYEQEFRARFPQTRPSEMSYLYYIDNPEYPGLRMHALVHNPTNDVYIWMIKA